MLTQWTDCTEARKALATWWLRDAQERKDYDALLVRLGELISVEIDPTVILATLSSSYYEIRTRGTEQQQSISVPLISRCRKAGTKMLSPAFAGTWIVSRTVTCP